MFLSLTLPVYAMQQVATANPEREAALKLLQEKRYAEAVKAWQKFLSETKNQTDSEAWIYLGLAHYRNNDLKEAREVLKKAVKLNPQSAQAHATYATILYAARKLADAEKEVNETLRLETNNQQSLYLRGVIQYDKGNCKEALADANSVLQLNPKFSSAYLLKAQAIIGIISARSVIDGDLPSNWTQAFLQAAQNIETYLQLNPNAPDSEFWRARMSTFRSYENVQASMGCIPFTKSAGITPPKILHQVPARYTDEARNAGIEGSIKVRAIFDIDGQIKNVVPLTFLGGGLTMQAILTAQKIKFSPATKDGKPICMSLAIEFTFNLLK